MTVSGIGPQINSLQALRAQNAFMKIQKTREENIQEVLKDVKVSISSKEINTDSTVRSEPKVTFSPYINEIKTFADKHITENIKEDDIQEALKYGTSLFADYTA